MSADEPVQFLGESDWDEQDLLTIDEAADRLEQELRSIEAALSAPEVERAAALRDRQRALVATLANIKSGPTDLARIN